MIKRILVGGVAAATAGALFLVPTGSNAAPAVATAAADRDVTPAQAAAVSKARALQALPVKKARAKFKKLPKAQAKAIAKLAKVDSVKVTKGPVIKVAPTEGDLKAADKIGAARQEVFCSYQWVEHAAYGGWPTYFKLYSAWQMVHWCETRTRMVSSRWVDRGGAAFFFTWFNRNEPKSGRLIMRLEHRRYHRETFGFIRYGWTASPCIQQRVDYHGNSKIMESCNLGG